jgi:RHS repeat-associated protein
VGVDINGNCTTNSTYYFYDPQGQRVGKQQYDTLEDYVYDPQGNIISVHDGSANLLRSELYSPGGRHVATWTPNPNGQYSDPYPPGLFWNHADWLGTERVRTDINGNLAETCTDTPYGMNLNCVDITVPADTGPMHFTGKQRDSESNLDYFSARYFGGGNSLGRFMTADPLMASAQVSSPQTWNRYIYGRNNPLKFLDPTGMKEETASDCAKDKLCVTVKLNVIYDKKANNGKGLTDKQKAGFGKQLQEAKDEYGNAHIHFDVAYGTSSVKGAENVIVSDSTPDMSAAFSGVRNGYAKTFLDVTQDDKETLSVELAHQFFGDTTGFADAFSRLEGTGMSNRLFDTYFDIRNDIARERLKVNNPFFMGSNYSLPEQLNEDFREGAREFQEAIRPQQK